MKKNLKKLIKNFKKLIYIEILNKIIKKKFELN